MAYNKVNIYGTCDITHNRWNYSVSDPKYEIAFIISIWYDDLISAVTYVSPCTKYLMMSPRNHKPT